MKPALIALTLALALSTAAEARPARWCGWQMVQWFGGDKSLYLARNWARVGAPARGPAIGAIVVWRSHVGYITGFRNGQWIVKSGNDSGRVRERPRSVSRAIAFRWPARHGRMRLASR